MALVRCISLYLLLVMGPVDACWPVAINSHHLQSHQKIFNRGKIYENDDPYIFSSDSFPSEPYHKPSVANGHIGAVIHHERMHMNCLYSGYRDNRSHRAEIPSTINVNLTGTSPPQNFIKKYKMNALQGTYIEEFHSSSGVIISQKIYAHRSVCALLVMEIEINLAHIGTSWEINLDVHRWWKSRDIDFVKTPSGMDNVSLMSGKTVIPETNTSGHTPVHVFFDEVPTVLHVHPSQSEEKWIFLTSIHPLKKEALEQFKLGVKLRKEGKLHQEHVSAWYDLWNNGRIDIAGNISFARMVAASQFYILSSLPSQDNPMWPFCGISPNGLPWGAKEDDYWGHYFWDQSTWIYPPVLLTHANIGRIIIGSRERTISAAAENARRLGLDGLKYAWESAFTGVETTYHEYTYASQELHINGDVVFAIMQYYWLTNDPTIFTEQNFDKIVLGVADFWISKMVLNASSGLYGMHGIQPPDEYVSNVSNSVYTNMVAKISLLAADMVQNLTGVSKVGLSYRYYAERMYIPFDENLQYHPEYDNYKLGSKIKQADAILLGFPLMASMPPQVRRNDLQFYQNVTDVNGPAMTWTMYAIGWLELQEFERAWENIRKVYGNVVNGFQVWSENINGTGSPNFLTGMGGLLQSVLFGFGGIRLKSNQVSINAVLPPGCHQMNFTGIDYQGNSVDMDVTEDQITFVLKSTEERVKKQLCLYDNLGHKTVFVLGKPISTERKRLYIKICENKT